MDSLQFWGYLAVLSQLVLLINVCWFRRINWDDVLPVDATCVYFTLSKDVSSPYARAVHSYRRGAVVPTSLALSLSGRRWDEFGTRK